VAPSITTSRTYARQVALGSPLLAGQLLQQRGDRRPRGVERARLGRCREAMSSPCACNASDSDSHDATPSRTGAPVT
jgi:hypothetical protein